MDGQGTVDGFDGKGLANSFHAGDSTTGTLTSPSFTVDSPYLNFKVGGGRHPHVPGTVMEQPRPEGTVLADFEGGTYGDWTPTGDAFGAAPATGTLPHQQEVSGWLGDGLVNTFLNGDSNTGTLTSPEFTIDKDRINFLIGGGHHPAPTTPPQSNSSSTARSSAAPPARAARPWTGPPSTCAPTRARRRGSRSST